MRSLGCGCLFGRLYALDGLDTKAIDLLTVIVLGDGADVAAMFQVDGGERHRPMQQTFRALDLGTESLEGLPTVPKFTLQPAALVHIGSS
jgi:hypothetical protein